MADETTAPVADPVTQAAPAAPAADYGDDFTPTGPDAADPGERVDNPDLAPKADGDKAPAPKAEPTVDPAPKAEPTVDDEAGRMIPKARFDTKNRMLRVQEDENRRLKNEIAALKAAGEKSATPPVLDLDAQLDAIDEKILAARKDGDFAAERALMAESRKITREHHAAEVAAASSRASNSAVEHVLLDGVIDDIEAAYPFLNPKDEAFSKEKADELVELWEAFELKGYHKTSALLKATSILFPDVDEPAAADPAVVAPDPKKTDIKRNIDTALKTPPNLEDAGGLASDKAGIKDDIKPSRLSEKDLEALPESVKARLRGDTI